MTNIFQRGWNHQPDFQGLRCLFGASTFQQEPSPESCRCRCTSSARPRAPGSASSASPTAARTSCAPADFDVRISWGFHLNGQMKSCRWEKNWNKLWWIFGATLRFWRNNTLIRGWGRNFKWRGLRKKPVRMLTNNIFVVFCGGLSEKKVISVVWTSDSKPKKWIYFLFRYFCLIFLVIRISLEIAAWVKCAEDMTFRNLFSAGATGWICPCSPFGQPVGASLRLPWHIVDSMTSTRDVRWWAQGSPNMSRDRHAERALGSQMIRT